MPTLKTHVTPKAGSKKANGPAMSASIRSKALKADRVARPLNAARTINATTARQGFFRLMDEAAESHTPILVTGRRNNTVLMSEEDYRGIQETLYLISIPGLREDILASLEEPPEKMVTRRTLKW